MLTKKINLVAADMGYGHQRAAYPLLDIGGNEIITINRYHGIPEWEKKYWKKTTEAYEKISRLKKIPVFGSFVFWVMDSFQKIKPFYPFRDLSRKTIQQKVFFRAIKAGLGKDLVEKLNSSGLPFVTTFFVAAYAAEYHNYQGDIYCIVCDTDISRAWAPLDPPKSRIKYFAPNTKVKERLLMYGVKEENIIITGFPLPKENIGENKEISEKDMARRVMALDKTGKFGEYYDFLSEKYPEIFSDKKDQPVSITFAVGGAGAQKEIGATILKKLADKIRADKYKLNLVAGNRPEVNEYFCEQVKESGLSNYDGVKIIFSPDKIEYFRKFNLCLKETDVLWTKPSELSFYVSLGLPIIMSSPVGSQEDYNREWLLALGAGIDSFDPEHVAEWLPDMLESGQLVRAAVDGFLNGEQLGAYNIEKIIDK